MPGLGVGEFTAGWYQDSRHVFVVRSGPAPRPVDLLDVGSGRRRPWRTLELPDATGYWLINFFASPDGRVVAANAWRSPTTLFLVEGLK